MAVDRILMIVSDTVRTDMLGYNGGGVRTPNLDRLAAKSMVFDRYYASSFPTVPARYDYLTGKPAFAGVGWGALPRTDRSIATTLTEAGYTTLGVVDTPFYQVNGYSYDRGFNFFYDMKSQLLGTPHYSSYTAPNKTKRQGEGKLPQWPITGKVKPDPRIGEMDCPAPLTMVQAAKCLEEIYQDKFFALVDTWDPHEPWDPPAYYVKHYLPDYAGERVHPPYGECKKHGMTDRDIAVARALYSGELELVDRWIGHLLDQLAYLGIEDSTAIIFVSDHGFLLGRAWADGQDGPQGARRSHLDAFAALRGDRQGAAVDPCAGRKARTNQQACLRARPCSHDLRHGRPAAPAGDAGTLATSRRAWSGVRRPRPCADGAAARQSRRYG